uniref:hypothetical protein n=1 Tax=Listeria monocytogenes TaxID=1639 RepID=UPI001A7E176E
QEFLSLNDLKRQIFEFISDYQNSAYRISIVWIAKQTFSSKYLLTHFNKSLSFLLKIRNSSFIVNN